MKLTVLGPIQDDGKPEEKEIIAKKIGPLAVHSSFGTLYAGLFTITHIRTGVAVYASFEFMAHAERAAKKMRSLAWGFTNFRVGSKNMKLRHEVAKAIQETRQSR